MCQLLETIKVVKCRLQNIDLHNTRVNYSRKALWNIDGGWDLNRFIKIPDLDPDKVYRCRFIYGKDVDTIEFVAYQPRKISKLVLAEAGDLDYSMKYADRTALDSLKRKFAPDADSDVLIVRNGKVTDVSFANIMFKNQHGWYTPACPLLKGTKRSLYLQQGWLREMSIEPNDIGHFTHARLINAMLDTEDGSEISTREIYWP
jgi:4-amino-4-deoxychorismate lyase